MELISELLASVILLLTRVFTIIKLVCFFPIRTGLIVINTWTELFRNAIIFNVNIILRFVSSVLGLFFLPARVVSSIERERQVSFYSILVCLYLSII